MAGCTTPRGTNEFMMHTTKDCFRDFVSNPYANAHDLLRCSMQPPSGGELLLLRPTGDGIPPGDHEHCQGRVALGRSHLLNFALRDDLSDQLDKHRGKECDKQSRWEKMSMLTIFSAASGVRDAKRNAAAIG
eukprot:CAMPEP_0203942868 /NCGR_PEP_ID=MMETSP0359-20131031/78958_1 /ASSEMBLY_ACC=CAM_ASM_000338 /TAXON_ID=268821 /ORGANISM="Scrippsiella Hangoei, Strain SHTV-5" /LENGTH=131 /DNA_ID=CAMNT_0050873643 /DNA_START=38 /DNA_END=434 /DNA_ORIENTATION=+